MFANSSARSTLQSLRTLGQESLSFLRTFLIATLILMVLQAHQFLDQLPACEANSEGIETHNN